jgi:DNA adenine methylase
MPIVSSDCQIVSKDNAINIKPFIRWAGGKQNLVKELSENLPKSFTGHYFEPFLGAGSLFFYNSFKKNTLADINPILVSTYNLIKDSPLEVSLRLEKHRKKISEEYYYKIREKFNRDIKKETFDQAANFIFLNHTSYNGIFRVNQKGEYNVPFGKMKAAIPNFEHLLRVSEKLKNSLITCCSYEKLLENVRSNDFIYLDPPYPPLNGTSFFQHYTADKFPVEEQINVSKKAHILSRNGILVMISNAETPLILDLYKEWHIKKVKTFRYINTKAKRIQVNELIITNY